jgi:hypothetical protein
MPPNMVPIAASRRIIANVVRQSVDSSCWPGRLILAWGIAEGGLMALEYEAQIYRLHLIDMLGVNDINEGKFVVIKGDEVSPAYDTYEDALEAAYQRHGLGPFLIKRIERNETVLYFSRDLK